MKNPPRYIVVDGPIGVGKTSLCKRLANTFGYQAMLENAETNPFLGRFYQNRKDNALATQLFFLFQRTQQLQNLLQTDLFEPHVVADYLFDKDDLFAQINLDEDEYKLYRSVYQKVETDHPKPDLVVYLQAPVDVLMQRIQQRGINEEQAIERRYLEQLNEAYSQFFLYYDGAPLLIVNAEQIDLANSQRDYEHFVDYMLTIKNGRHFYNPTIFS